MTQPKRDLSITAANVLILLSLLILPTLLYLAASNVVGVANTLNLVNSNQTYEQDELTISGTLTLNNPGPFTLEGAFEATLDDGGGIRLPIQGPRLQLPPGMYRVPVAVTVDLTSLSEKDLGDLALNAENFTLTARATLGLQPVASIAADATAKIHWRPPMHNLTVGEPTVRTFSATIIGVDVPVSFDNQSPFELGAVDRVTVFDSNGLRVGEGKLVIESMPGTKFSQSIQLEITPPAAVDALSDHIYTYSAESTLTLPNGNFTIPLSQRHIQVFWGALVKDPKLIAKVTPIDLASSRIDYEVTYVDNNQFLPLDASFTPRILKGSETLVTAPSQSIYTDPMSLGVISGQFIVPNSVLLQSGLHMVLHISTTFGEYDLEVGSLG